MMLSDIFQIAALCALVFFGLGFMARRSLPYGLRYWKNRLLRPRYLKSEGSWVSDQTTSQAKK